MNSFISWIGGKKALRERIIKEFPEKGTYNRYVEVFGGAGWVLFSSEKHAETEVYNDINGNLVNLFRCVKYHPEEMQKELELVFMSREQFWDAKAQLQVQGLTDIQRAARFYIIIKESYGTTLRSFGLRSKNMDSAREYLLAVSKRLSAVVIENLDFQKIIKNNDRKETLFYFDPPYYDAEKYYPDKFTKEDHDRLEKALREIRGKFILSYNDCGYIREQYKGYHVIEADRLNNLAPPKGSPRYPELIIKNFV